MAVPEAQAERERSHYTGGVLEPSAASSPSGETRTPRTLFALKSGNLFVVADSHGDIVGDQDGLFLDDTRLLSNFRLTLAGHSPSILSSRVSGDNVLFVSHMTNRPLPPLGGASLPEGVIHIERQRLLWEGRLLERILLTSFAEQDTTLPLELEMAADFRDMFEVRGMTRARRGRLETPRYGLKSIQFGYIGLDGATRRSIVRVSRSAFSFDGRIAQFPMAIGSRCTSILHLEVGPDRDGPAPNEERWRAACAAARRAMRRRLHRGARLRASNPVFHQWLERSRADLALLSSDLETGPYPYAGIPWFSTPFGRDGIITALQTLWIEPALARGVLSFLARHQATETSAFRDSAPGKIMHECRRGEMAALGEIPFGLYYGGVDTTPLFVMLAGAYLERTGDLAFVEKIWPALERAIGWIEGSGDSNGDGLLDYARGQDTGLSNQGWKDSNDSVFHADGSDPVGPIALVEVQGYVFAAYTAMARLHEWRGDADQAADFARRAHVLRQKIEERYWMEAKGFYALAVDGAARLCAVRASNAAHLLFTGVPSHHRARKTIDALLGAPFANGWGIRTLAYDEARYNPMSYHNGSVWPHDTAIAAAGMARYGERDGVVRLLSEMFDAAVRFDMRLPELFCGIARCGAGDAPVGYPVACMPQAWAAGAVFMMLQAALGVSIDARRGVRVSKPRLPAGVDSLIVSDLDISGRKETLTFQSVGAGVSAYSDRHFGGAVPLNTLREPERP